MLDAARFSDNTEAHRAGMSKILIEGLHKTYASSSGRVTALENVSLSIKQNEFVTLVGPSGCGKSTLLKLIGALIRPTRGTLLFDGTPLLKPTRDVGIVFQEAVLLQWRTVLDNVLLPTEILGLDRTASRKRAMDLISLVGLGGFEQRFPRELSGGMQQRVSLCRALIHNPSVLLMDEPFAALDAMTREELGFELMRIWDKDKKTVIFVTHNITEAILLADRVVAMSPRPGRIARVVDVDLPRPRTIDMEFTEKFKIVFGADPRRDLSQPGSEQAMTVDASIANLDEDESLEPADSTLKAILGATVTLIALVVVWEFLVRYFQVPGWLLPSPSSIWQAMVEWRSELVGHSLVTLYETLVGFALSIVISVPLAVAVVYSPLLQNTIYPILLALQSMPKVAIAPLLALWIGFGTLPKIVVVFLVCFFPIIVATASGLTAVPASLMDLIRSLSASPLQTFVKIRFPTAMPHIFVGLKIAITFAVIGAVIGEFVGSESGLGYLILVSTSQSRTPLAFGALVLLTIMSIVLYYGIALTERILVPWAPRN